MTLDCHVMREFKRSSFSVEISFKRINNLIGRENFRATGFSTMRGWGLHLPSVKKITKSPPIRSHPPPPPPPHLRTKFLHLPFKSLSPPTFT